MASSDVIVPNSAMDYPEHEKTYRLFLSLVKWGSIGCIGAIVLLAIFTL
ncbi:aa3-type cytochrome c oxidase subunit IV [Methylovirgula sp. 4M-Z18]|nr:aa3-type cytochrome c oxidase subunit IV [Methylovirgula sp. 4M-Z18]RFB78712.1 aa3-type cytochrome c oxidase subunit IV [Methylovirgula sp. 4M-Z18]